MSFRIFLNKNPYHVTGNIFFHSNLFSHESDYSSTTPGMTELLDNDGALLFDNDGTQLLDNV